MTEKRKHAILFCRDAFVCAETDRLDGTRQADDGEANLGGQDKAIQEVECILDRIDKRWPDRQQKLNAEYSLRPRSTILPHLLRQIWRTNM